MTRRSQLHVATLLSGLLLACRASPPTPSAPPPPRAAERVVAAAPGPVAELVVRERMRLVASDPARRVLVYVGASWCEPCKRFHDAFAAGALDSKLPHVTLLEFDLDRDEARLEAAGYHSDFVPHFAVPGPDGRASGQAVRGAIKGDGAVDFLLPKLEALLRPSG